MSSKLKKQLKKEAKVAEREKKVSSIKADIFEAQKCLRTALAKGDISLADQITSKINKLREEL